MCVAYTYGQIDLRLSILLAIVAICTKTIKVLKVKLVVKFKIMGKYGCDIELVTKSMPGFDKTYYITIRDMAIFKQ